MLMFPASPKSYTDANVIAVVKEVITEGQGRVHPLFVVLNLFSTASAQYSATNVINVFEALIKEGVTGSCSKALRRLSTPV